MVLFGDSSHVRSLRAFRTINTLFIGALLFEPDISNLTVVGIISEREGSVPTALWALVLNVHLFQKSLIHFIRSPYICTHEIKPGCGSSSSSFNFST
jgi:hypothetical protein